MTASRGLRAALLASVIAGCAINPVTRRPELVLISAETEKRLGKQEAEKVEQGIGFLDDASLQTYVSEVGERLAARSPRGDVAYAFHIVDVADPNAFSLPGGYVYVTRGLLVLTNSEDELACIIAHEIGHVAARHTVQQISASAPFALLTGIGAGVTGLVSPLLGRIVGRVGGLASGLVLAPYSRSQEREADRVGQQLAAEAGWDPERMTRFLETLQRQQELTTGSSPRPGFLDSHPATPERIRNTAEYAHQLARAPVPPLSASRATFLQRFDGLVVGARAANGIFEGPLFLQPDMDFALRFPQDWQRQNGRTEVAAAAPRGDAVIVLQLAGKGNDPLAAARALQERTRSPLVKDTRETTIGGLQAVRTQVQARSEHGLLLVDLTWIAQAGRIFQITGLTPVERSSAYQPDFDLVAKSFRPLSAAERARIREDRLRIVTARPGEMLDSLVARTSSVWTAERVAAVNGLSVNQPLQSGQLVKVVLNEPYVAGTAR